MRMLARAPASMQHACTRHTYSTPRTRAQDRADLAHVVGHGTRTSSRHRLTQRAKRLLVTAVSCHCRAAMASRYGDALGWGDISPVKRTVLEQRALRAPISPIPSPRQLRALEEFAHSPLAGVTDVTSTPNSAVVITTGSDELDTLLGGGVETGAVTEIRCSAQAMLHLVCALSVTTQLPEAAPGAPQHVPGRLYGMKLFGGANGKVMVIDTRGDYLDGRSFIYAVCHRFSLDPEAVLENITYTCTAVHGRHTSAPDAPTDEGDRSRAGPNTGLEAEEKEDEEQQEKQKEKEHSEEDKETEKKEQDHTGFSPVGFLLHYSGQTPAWTFAAPEPEPEPAPGSVSPWPDLLSQSQSGFLTVSEQAEKFETIEADERVSAHLGALERVEQFPLPVILHTQVTSLCDTGAPWPASLGVAAQKKRQLEEEQAAEAATRRGLATLYSSSDEEAETASKRSHGPKQAPEPVERSPEDLEQTGRDREQREEQEQANEQQQEQEEILDEALLDLSTGAWQMELLQEAAELIVSEAGTHPSYRCLIVMHPQNFFEDWTEKSRDEVLEKLSDHVTVRASHSLAQPLICSRNAETNLVVRASYA